MVVLWDLSGTLVHNNKSLGTGDLPEGTNALEAHQSGLLPKGYYLTKPGDIVWIDGALAAGLVRIRAFLLHLSEVSRLLPPIGAIVKCSSVG